MAITIARPRVSGTNSQWYAAVIANWILDQTITSIVSGIRGYRYRMIRGR